MDALEGRLDRWKLSLLDLTLRNRLLDAKDGRQVVPLAGDAAMLAAALTGDVAFRLEASAVAEGAIQTVNDALGKQQMLVALPAEELERRLTAIARAARESLSEGGARTLWIGLGMLRWFDPGEPELARHAPLVLVPAELRRAGARDRYKLSIVEDEDWRWNDTLLEKLAREHGIRVARPDPDAELDVAAVLAAVAAAIDGKAGWAVLPEARLGIFAFTKFVMWTDLAERGDALLAAPVVRHLAAGAGTAYPDQGAFPDPAVLDQAVPLSELYAPLDCDASQLAAVLAAAQGKSFVLQGPPGTGKSQTITNLIAQCLATGRTVLFVSEKIAALEVVQRRLAAAGLADFCLPLHSHRAKKREVIVELGRVLERVWRPGAIGGDDNRLEASRAALNRHARALHTPGRAGVSVHDALARLGALRTAPAVRGGDSTANRTAAEVAAQAEAAERLALTGAEVAPVARHPWRGSTLSAWQLESGDEVAAAVTEAQAAVAELRAAVAAMPGVVPGLAPRTCAELDAAGALAEVAIASPRPGAELIFEAGGGKRSDVALVKTTLEAAPRDVGTWLMLERQGRALDRRLDGRWTGKIYELDTGRLAETFRRSAGRFFVFRWFALRGPRALVKQALAGGPMPDDLTVADDLDAADVVRKTDDLLDAARPAARRWLGALAAAAEPDADLEPVERAIGWVGELRAAFDRLGLDPAVREGAWRALVAAVSDGAGDGAPVFATLARAVGRWRAALARLAQVCGVDAAAIGEQRDTMGGGGPAGFAGGAGGNAPRGSDGVGGHLIALAGRADAWAAAPGALRDWAAYVRARDAALAAGLGELVTRIEDGSLASADVVRAWERAFLVGVASAGIGAAPELAEFHGASHHARVVEFGELDRAHLQRARARAVARLAERVPRIAAGAGETADSGEIGVLLHEAKKQRRHRPLRALFREIPTLLTRLKPCLLMSPLSVAQYLDPTAPGLARFDVVVFDEASQIPTADAIGALARGEAAVIVGDSKQLPPTRFFAPAAGEPPDDRDDGDDEIVELESVLDECVAARLPELRLTWHYRSRHEDLIAFSNERYYGGGLDVFPAPAARAGELGVAWRKIEGVYDRAGARTNRAEAEAVVAEVVARLSDPERAKHSIGVVTFSKPQQELVLDLLDEARRAHPALERNFTASDEVPEPVLVKNLETIQGDERDVILFSIGYGPDADGKLTMNFGPLNRDGGERRLNVAITRAREHLIVFSSIEPEMIAGDVAARGVRDLAALLAYARGGRDEVRGLEPPASAVTAAIARAIEAKGFVVHHRVGCAGYRIDLAVVDPDDPGKYVLGIETDGPAYARAATARDRDRLRALVLGNLGWRLHRIWTLDWWHEADKETTRLNSAVIAAIAAARAARTPRPARPASAPPPVRPAPRPEVTARTSRPVVIIPPRTPAATSAPVPRTVPAAGSPPRGRAPTATDRAMAAAPAIAPYKVASVPPGRWTQDDFYDRARDADIGRTIDAVLAVEAPVHLSLLSRRVGAYFGVGRVTARVIERVRELAGDRARVGGDGDPDVVWRADQDPAAWPVVRVPDDKPETRRDVDELPLSEIAAAALVVLNRNLGLPAADLARETAKLLGFARQGEKVGKRMADGVAALAAKGLCRIDGDRVSLPDPAA